MLLHCLTYFWRQTHIKISWDLLGSLLFTIWLWLYTYIPIYQMLYLLVHHFNVFITVQLQFTYNWIIFFASLFYLFVLDLHFHVWRNKYRMNLVMSWMQFVCCSQWWDCADHTGPGPIPADDAVARRWNCSLSNYSSTIKFVKGPQWLAVGSQTQQTAHGTLLLANNIGIPHNRAGRWSPPWI